MKAMTKLVVGGAVLAAATAAHASNTIPAPSTDNSNLLFFVNDVTTHTTYTLVLSETINGAGGYFTTADATSNSGAPAQGTNLGEIFGDASFSINLSGDSALQTFITNAQTAGNTLQWGLEAGAYSGVTSTARAPQGNSLAITSSLSGTSVLPVAESAIIGGIATGINTDVKNLNSQTYDASNGTTSGIIGTPTSTNQNVNMYGAGVQQGNPIGTGASLYGLTSNGSTSGQLLGYLLGTVTFNGTTLAFTGETSAVPVPAAGWLLGSGLLGLLGIARRRSLGVATA